MENGMNSTEGIINDSYNYIIISTKIVFWKAVILPPPLVQGILEMSNIAAQLSGQCLSLCNSSDRPRGRMDTLTDENFECSSSGKEEHINVKQQHVVVIGIFKTRKEP